MNTFKLYTFWTIEFDGTFATIVLAISCGEVLLPV